MAENSSFPETDDSLVVECEGVSFETLVPERVWLIPENQPGAETCVKFGIRMTNQTQKAMRFCSYRTLWPALIGPNGKPLPFDAGANASRFMLESECPLVEPGENVTFFLSGKLTWNNSNKLYLGGHLECGGVWHFHDDIKPGKYGLYFRYNSPHQRRMYDPKIKKTRLLENIWSAQVETPLIEISVILP